MNTRSSGLGRGRQGNVLEGRGGEGLERGAGHPDAETPRFMGALSTGRFSINYSVFFSVDMSNVPLFRNI